MPIFEVQGPNGKTYEVDAPDMQSAANAVASMGGAPAQPAESDAARQFRTDASATTQQYDQPAAPKRDLMRDAAYVGQRADRGIADALGAPVDLMTLGLNTGAWGIDKIAELFGGNFDGRIEKPVMGGDWIADMVSGAYEGVGGHVIPDEEVSDATRMVGNAARGAGSVVVPGLGLASKSAQARKVLSPIAKPYAVTPGAALARDAVAGAGSGVAMDAYEQYTPDVVQQSAFGPLLKALAAMAGGIGGAGTANIIEGGGKGVWNTIRNAVAGKGDPNAPINPATGQPFTRTEMDSAARIAQQMPTNKSQAVSNIEDGAREFRQFASEPEVPTTGMLADDIGMAIQENILRTKDARRFAERDAQRRGKASRLVDQSAPANADSRDMTKALDAQYDDFTLGAKQALDEATKNEANFVRDIQDRNASLETYRANQPQASAAMAEDFGAARRAARSDKNAAYDAIDPATPVDGRFIGEALRRIDASMSRAERMAPGPYAEIAARAQELVEGGPVTWGDIKALRAQVSEARKNSVAASGRSVAGSGADVERLDELNRVLGHLADQVNPEAARFYSEEYAPRFKTGKAGEYGAAVDRAARTGGESSATRPSEFGDKFLRKPEDAESLRRAMSPIPQRVPQIEGPSPGGPAPNNANLERNARDWMLGDLAKSGVLTPDAELRYDKFRQWTDKNRKTIDQFPTLANEINRELANAQRGGFLSRQLAAEVKAAKEGLGRKQGELRDSALSIARGNSPENAVGAIMSSGDPERRMAEIVSRVRNDPEALAGLKAATRDWIKDKAGTTSRVVGDPGAAKLSRANMEKIFQQHEGTLAAIYSPEEMNVLRQAQKLLGAEANLDVKTTAGSNTADKAMAISQDAYTKRQRVLEAALKAKFGVLKGGGMFRTINLFLQSLPDGSRALDDILFEMQFNPELASHLLKRPVKEIGTDAWNRKLNRLLAIAAGQREADSEDRGDARFRRQPTEITVTEPANR